MHAAAPMHAGGQVSIHAVPGAATGPYQIRSATGAAPFHGNGFHGNGFHDGHCGVNCRGHIRNYPAGYAYYPIYYPVYGETYADNSAEQPVNYEGVENTDAPQPDRSQSQLDRLTYEVEQLRADEESRQNQHEESASAPKDLGSVTPTVLVFADGHQIQINNYALVGHTVWVLSDHTATQKIPIAQLDLPATIKANEDNGVEFSVP